MTDELLPLPLPGAVGLSHISAYDWEAADGVCGGSPHAHLVCTEAYVVTAGRGAVQTLTPDGYRETELEPGAVVWFTPGTVHRMVQRDGLRVTVLMQNSGLPEAGDAVFTFPPEVLANPERYAAAAALPRTDGKRAGPAPEASPQPHGHDSAEAGAELAHAARRRRDLAVEGYLTLREALKKGDPGPLRDFHRAAARLVAPKLPRWEALWRAGALATAQRTGAQMEALAAGDPAHLSRARVGSANPTRLGGYGMCGRRDEYELPGTTLPYYGE